MTKMNQRGYTHADLSNDDLTKEHLRHMVGGSKVAPKELVYEVTFPERPRALSDFLQAVGTTWNISLFHYRSAASDTGSVLVGFETDDRHSLEQQLAKTGFEYTEVGHTPGFGLLVAGTGE